MNVYRITYTKYANDLSGEGSKLFGSRWNYPGVYCLYAAESRALAMLEFAVNTKLEDIPRTLSVITYNIPDQFHPLSIAGLPGNWSNPKIPDDTRGLGTKLLREAKHIAIRVPSVIIHEEYNFLINPRHADIKHVTIAAIADFSFDVRLKK